MPGTGGPRGPGAHPGGPPGPGGMPNCPGGGCWPSIGGGTPRAAGSPGWPSPDAVASPVGAIPASLPLRDGGNDPLSVGRGGSGGFWSDGGSGGETIDLFCVDAPSSLSPSSPDPKMSPPNSSSSSSSPSFLPFLISSTASAVSPVRRVAVVTAISAFCLANAFSSASLTNFSRSCCSVRARRRNSSTDVRSTLFGRSWNAKDTARDSLVDREHGRKQQVATLSPSRVTYWPCCTADT